MNKRLRTLLQLLVGILISAALLYLTYRKRSFSDLLADMGQADPALLVMSGGVLLLVFWLRAMRWRIMIQSADHPVRAYPTFLAVTIGYLVNAVTPKIGEIVRCTALYRSDKVPVATSIGTVFTERIIDALVLLGGIFVIFLMEVDRLGKLFKDIAANLFGSWSTAQVFILLAVLAAMMIGGILFLVWLRKRATAESANPGLISKINEFVSGMLHAVKSIFRLRQPGMFILYTVLVWIALIIMNVLFLKALPMTQDLSPYYAVLVLFIGGIGWAMPVPAGMGTTHYIVTMLFVAFNLPEEMGENVGLLSNGATFLFTIIWGLAAWGLYLLFLVSDKKKQLGE
ncbi:MAG: flippase-like domain-containing protein [Bacteroidia bacterium]|nr:flippase-like domain-containing protein [Bacteroidia bacterium]